MQIIHRQPTCIVISVTSSQFVLFIYFLKLKLSAKIDKIVCTIVKHQMRHSEVILELMTTTINFQQKNVSYGEQVIEN